MGNNILMCCTGRNRLNVFERDSTPEKANTLNEYKDHNIEISSSKSYIVFLTYRLQRKTCK